MKDARSALWKEHQETWTNCARCKLVDDRLLQDPKKEKYRTQVPMPGTLATCQNWKNIEPLPSAPLALMLSYPDPRQETHRCMWADVSKKALYWSPQIQTLLNSQLMIGPENLPFDLRDVPIFSALGCRPLNHRDFRYTLPPAAGPTSKCRPRWVAELRMIDPQLVIAFGHHAFVALFPKRAKRDEFNQSVGEVLEFEVEGAKGPLKYSAYIAPCVSEVHTEARPEHWKKKFKFKRPGARSQGYVQDLRWHLFRASWLAHVLHVNRDHPDLAVMPDHPAWAKMIAGSNHFHDAKANIVETAKAVNKRVNRMNRIETSDQDVRKALAGDICPERGDLDNIPVTHAFAAPAQISERRLRKMEREESEAQATEES